MDYLDEVGDENKFKSYMSYTNREMEMTIERIRCNNREMERLQRYTRRNRVEDFKPKKYLRPHNFNKESKARFISPGVYIEGNMSTTSGYNSIAIGYYNNNGQPNRIRYE